MSTMLNSLKRITYRPEVLKPVRRLGLSSVLRRAYFQFAKPANGILETEIAGVPVKFFIRTPGELRNLDPSGAGQQEWHVLKRLKGSLRGGDTFYDIGSNVGLYSVVLGKALGDDGKVFAFEPMRQAFEHLQENIRLNGLTNVKVFHKAVGETPQRLRLYLGDENADSSLVRPRSEQNCSIEMVDVIQGDGFIHEQQLPTPNVVKVDVEGFEVAVLRGLAQTLASAPCRMVCCEVHPALLPEDVEPDAIFQILRTSGFNQIESHPRKDTFHVIAAKDEH